MSEEKVEEKVASEKQASIDKEKPLSKKELEAELALLRAEQLKRDDEVKAEREKRTALEKSLQELSSKLDGKLDLPKPETKQLTPADGAAYLEWLAKEQEAKIEAVQKAAERALAAQEARVKEMEENFRRKELDLHRSRLIERTALKEMVTGNTVDELEASLKKAQDLEAKLREQLKKEVAEESAKNLPKPGNPVGVEPRATNFTRTHKERVDAIAKNREAFNTDFDKRARELLIKKGFAS